MRNAVGVLLAALCFASTASAAIPQGHAGRFVYQGAEGMWRIGLRLPFEGPARIHIIGCRVWPERATCRLAVRSSGIKCRVRMDLTRRGPSFPSRSWHCPAEWRPVSLRYPDLGRLQARKAL